MLGGIRLCSIEDAYHEYAKRLMAVDGQRTESKGENGNEGKKPGAASTHGKASKQEESWTYKYLVPPLWKSKGNSDRDWAEEVLKNKLEEWGNAMKNSGHWSGGVIEELGKDGASMKDVPRGIKKGVWPG